MIVSGAQLLLVAGLSLAVPICAAPSPQSANTSNDKSTGVDLSKLGPSGGPATKYMEQTTLTITVPYIETATDQIREYAKKLQAPESMATAKSNHPQDSSSDSDYGDDDPEDELRYYSGAAEVLEFMIPQQSSAAFERFVERICLKSFPCQKVRQNIPMRSSLRSHAKDTPPGNYIIELRGIKLNKISASISVLTTSIDNNQFLGGNIGIHGANAALGFAVGNLRGKDHKQFIFADITNYFRIIPLSFSRGRWAPVIGYDFGITSIDHKSFAMTGINVGPSYTNYKSYSLALLTRFAALLTQTESKFITMPGLEMRYFF